MLTSLTSGPPGDRPSLIAPVDDRAPIDQQRASGAEASMRDMMAIAASARSLPRVARRMPEPTAKPTGMIPGENDEARHHDLDQ
jgi:hypothetical protein